VLSAMVAAEIEEASANKAIFIILFLEKLLKRLLFMRSAFGNLIEESINNLQAVQAK
jgi:hypothetical protein